MSEKDSITTDPLMAIFKAHVSNLEDKAAQWDAIQPVLEKMTLVIEAARGHRNDWGGGQLDNALTELDELTNG